MQAMLAYTQQLAFIAVPEKRACQGLGCVASHLLIGARSIEHVGSPADIGAAEATRCVHDNSAY